MISQNFSESESQNLSESQSLNQSQIINKINNIIDEDINTLVIDNNAKEPILLHACAYNYIEVAKVLLEKKYNMDIINCLGESLIHLIVKYERNDWLDSFSKFLNFHRLTYSNQTVYHYATAIANTNMIEFLFSIDPTCSFLDLIDDLGYSALALAIRFDNVHYFKIHLMYCKRQEQYQNNIVFEEFLSNTVLQAIAKENATNCFKALKEILTPEVFNALIKKNAENLIKIMNKNGFYEFVKEIRLITKEIPPLSYLCLQKLLLTPKLSMRFKKDLKNWLVSRAQTIEEENPEVCDQSELRESKKLMPC